MIRQKILDSKVKKSIYFKKKNELSQFLVSNNILLF